MSRYEAVSRPPQHAVERLARMARVVLTPGGLRALGTWRPLSLAGFLLTEGLLAEGLSFATILDVGANAGQFARAALGRWPTATVIAFEPLPDIAQRLRRTLARLGQHEVHVVALGAEDGRTTFYRHAYSLSSSALPLSHPTSTEDVRIEVPQLRLDRVLADRQIPRPVLLKIDVQGYELEVLAGAAETLRTVDAIVIEQAFDRVYDGQPLFSEVNRFLEGAGWHLVRPLDFRSQDGRVVEIDGLYRRTTATEERQSRRQGSHRIHNPYSSRRGTAPSDT